MRPGFDSSTHEALGGLPPGWRLHEVKIRVFDLSKQGEEAECGSLLTRLHVSADSDTEQLVSMSIAPRPVYTEAGNIFLDITWAVLRPIQKPVSSLVPVTSDRREPHTAAAAARDSFASTPVATAQSKPLQLNLD